MDNKVVWEKSISTYEKEFVQSKLNLRIELQDLGQKVSTDRQQNVTELGDMFLDLRRSNDLVKDQEKVEVLLGLILECFGFIV